MATNWRERIAVDLKVLVGKPVIKGTRLAVEFVVDLLAAGWTQQQILDNYPHIRQEDIQACTNAPFRLLPDDTTGPLPVLLDACVLVNYEPRYSQEILASRNHLRGRG